MIYVAIAVVCVCVSSLVGLKMVMNFFERLDREATRGMERHLDRLNTPPVSPPPPPKR